MATTKLGLPTITGNMTADVVRDVNALAEAVDTSTASQSDLDGLSEEVNAHLAETVSNDVHGLLSGGKIIEESGSNSNGSYVKFADGTQICWKTNDFTGLSPTSNTSQGLTVYYVTLTFPYAATFISSPTIEVSGDIYGSGYREIIWASASNNSYSNIGVEALNTFSVVKIHQFAIGRWK